jgi:Tfp pilus assembly protein PilN
MRAVNLLPRDEQRVRVEGARTPLLLVAVGIAAVTAGALVVSFSTSGTADERRTELALVEAAIARLPTAPEPALTRGALLRERTERTSSLSAALSARVSFDRLLREIAFVLPEDAWLTGLRAVAPPSAAPATGGPQPPPSPSSSLEGVTIEGATYTHDSVALVLARLAVVPSLEDVRLLATARVEPLPTETEGPGGEPAPSTTQGKTYVSFTISAALRTGGQS